MNYKGTIVEESLIDNRLINNFKINKIRISDAEKPEDRWHLYDVEVSSKQINALATQLRPKGWYMHFWQGDNVIVVFPSKEFNIKYSDQRTWKDAVAYGESIGIPSEQLDFKIEEISNLRGKYYLNGLQKTQPRGAEYVTKKVLKKQYLQDILSRLEDEVGFIAKAIQGYNQRPQNKNKIGFFSMVRVVMPLVEVVSASEGREPYDLMKDLGMPLPYTQWDAYRDIFMHNDEFVGIAIKDSDQGLQVGISLATPDDSEVDDFLAQDGRNINPYRIHSALAKYLVAKIKDTNETDEVDIIGLLKYDRTSSDVNIQSAISEIEKFHQSAG